MSSRNFAMLAAAIFAVIALVQLMRAASGWPVTVGTTMVPVWISWIAVVVAGGLAWLGFAASRT